MRRLLFPVLLLCACRSSASPTAASIADPPASSASPPLPASAAPRAVPPPPLDQSEAMSLGLAQEALRDVKGLVARGQMSDPQKPDEGNATMKCSSIEMGRKVLGSRPEPQIRRLFEDAVPLCEREVRVLQTEENLAEIKGSKDAALVRLTCGLCDLDLRKLEASYASDARVPDLRARWRGRCSEKNDAVAYATNATLNAAETPKEHRNIVCQGAEDPVKALETASPRDGRVAGARKLWDERCKPWVH